MSLPCRARPPRPPPRPLSLKGARRDFGEALTKTGRVEAAAEALERGVAVWPFSADLQQALILRYMALDRTATMLEALRRYMQLFPEDAVAREALKGADEHNP